MTFTSATTRTTRPRRRATSRSRAGRAAQTARLLDEMSTTDDPDVRRHLAARVVVLNLDSTLGVGASYRGRGVAADELDEVACEALVRATQRYDPTCPVPFLVHAVALVGAELQRHVRAAEGEESPGLRPGLVRAVADRRDRVVTWVRDRVPVGPG